MSPEEEKRREKIKRSREWNLKNRERFKANLKRHRIKNRVETYKKIYEKEDARKDETEKIKSELESWINNKETDDT